MGKSEGPVPSICDWRVSTKILPSRAGRMSVESRWQVSSHLITLTR